MSAMVVALALSMPAHAQSADSDVEDVDDVDDVDDVEVPDDVDGEFYDVEPAERRSGFTFGVSTGLLVGTASGYPSDYDKVDQSEYKLDTGLASTYGMTAWIGGALQDWFMFGVGGTALQFSGDDLVASGGAFLIRLEFFPLFYLGGVWRDLGACANFGVGGLTIEGDDRVAAEGAGVSVVGTGLFWEALRWGTASIGPGVEYTYMATSNVTAHTVQIGARLVIYSGP